MFGSACAGPPQSPVAGLPDYGPEDAALLDDGLSGHLFETAFVPGDANDDPHFKDRVLRAESIWLVKVATVSSEGSLGNNRGFGLSLRPLKSLVGVALTEPVSLTISARDPAFHWLERAGGAWMGHEVLLLVRRFREGDKPVLHFHGEPNTPELRAQILELWRGVTLQNQASTPQK